METQLIIEYLWVLILLIGLEGLLAADNALVLAILVRHLPDKERKKALYYGLVGAVVLRLASLFFISFFVNMWQIQAIGAIYLLYISISYMIKKVTQTDESTEEKHGKSGFWLTVLKVELADLAFAVDSILAAIAIAVTLPVTGIFTVGSLDGAQFLVVFFGGIIGVIIMRFAASIFVDLLKKRPGLEVAAFAMVGWIGIKLSTLVLAHNEINIISEAFAHSTGWKITFYLVLIIIAVLGWFLSVEEEAIEE